MYHFLVFIIVLSMSGSTCSASWMRDFQTSQEKNQGTPLERLSQGERPISPLKPGKYVNNQPQSSLAERHENSNQLEVKVKQDAPAKQEPLVKVENNIISIRSYFLNPAGDSSARVSLQVKDTNQIFTFSGNPQSLSNAAKSDMVRFYKEPAVKDEAAGKSTNSTKLMDMLDGKARGTVTITLTISPNGAQAVRLESVVGGNKADTAIEKVRDNVISESAPNTARNQVVSVGGSQTTFAFKGDAKVLTPEIRNTLLSQVDMKKMSAEDLKQLDPKVVVTDANSKPDTRLVKIMKGQQPGTVDITVTVNPEKRMQVQFNNASIGAPPSPVSGSESAAAKNIAAKSFADGEIKAGAQPLLKATNVLKQSPANIQSQLPQIQEDLKQVVVAYSNLLDKPALSAQKKDLTTTLDKSYTALNQPSLKIERLKDIAKDLRNVQDTMWEASRKWYLKP